jgi:hypothetical protein
MIDLPSNKDRSSGSSDVKPCSRLPSVPDSGGHMGRRVVDSQGEDEDPISRHPAAAAEMLAFKRNTNFRRNTCFW